MIRDILFEAGLVEASTAGQVLERSALATQTLLSHRIFAKCDTLFTTPEEQMLKTKGPAHVLTLRPSSLFQKGDVDANFFVQEKTRMFGGGGGVQFRGFDGGMNFNVKHYNIGGRLEQLGLQLFAGQLSQSLNVDLSVPVFNHPFVRRWGVELKGYREDHLENSSFRQENLNLTATLDTKKGHSFTYEASIRNVDLKRRIDSQVVLDGGISVKSSIAHNFALDGRDNPVVPFEGAAVNFVGDSGAIEFRLIGAFSGQSWRDWEETRTF